MIVTIQPGQARTGMYVVSFKAGWLSHPFWRTHFTLSSQKEIDKILEAGLPLCIDTAKGCGPIAQDAPQPKSAPPSPSQPHPSQPHPSRSRPAPRRAAPAQAFRVPARPVQFGQAGRGSAAALAKRSAAVVEAMFEECRLGRNIPATQLLAVVDEISEALEQDSAAFLAVTRLKAKDDHTYTHSVSVCALMISLGRRNGYSAEQLRDLGMAGLLHDVGKLRVPDAVIQNRDQLTPEDAEEMRRHPVYGHEMLLASENIPAVALDVCLHHHERLDGSGYPSGLKASEIGEAVRISSICDLYDRMTSNRPRMKGLTPTEAITQLHAMEGQLDPRLLFQLMVEFGVYPADMLVRLRSNRLAIALPPRSKDARTLFRAFYSTVDTQFIPYETVTPGESLADDLPVSREDPAAWFSGEWPVMADRIRRAMPGLIAQ